MISTCEKKDSDTVEQLKKTLHSERAGSAIIRSSVLIVLSLLLLIPLPLPLSTLKIVVLIFTAYGSMFNLMDVLKKFSGLTDRKSSIARTVAIMAVVLSLVVFLNIGIKLSYIAQYWASLAM